LGGRIISRIDHPRSPINETARCAVRACCDSQQMRRDATRTSADERARGEDATRTQGGSPIPPREEFYDALALICNVETSDRYGSLKKIRKMSQIDASKRKTCCLSLFLYTNTCTNHLKKLFSVYINLRAPFCPCPVSLAIPMVLDFANRAK